MCTNEDDQGAKQSTPLLFVMKKEGDNWKIASIRVLAR
jgi:ketosteroid isomerase-like protein